MSIELCEENQDLARSINRDIPHLLADASAQSRSRLIQISTDHYYTGDQDMLHTEDHKVKCVNTYAKTKYEGELMALQYENTLVVRTNITGKRGMAGKPTFIEWLTDQIVKKKPLTLFEDFYTSTIDTNTFCKLCMNTELEDYRGVINIASATAVSKKEFANHLAQELGVALDWAESASVSKLKVRRAESLGLDWTIFETISGHSPSMLKQSKTCQGESRSLE